jgi:hypothetical protein
VGGTIISRPDCGLIVAQLCPGGSFRQPEPDKITACAALWNFRRKNAGARSALTW